MEPVITALRSLQIGLQDTEQIAYRILSIDPGTLFPLFCTDIPAQASHFNVTFDNLYNSNKFTYQVLGGIFPPVHERVCIFDTSWGWHWIDEVYPDQSPGDHFAFYITGPYARLRHLYCKTIVYHSNLHSLDRKPRKRKDSVSTALRIDPWIQFADNTTL